MRRPLHLVLALALTAATGCKDGHGSRATEDASDPEFDAGEPIGDAGDTGPRRASDAGTSDAGTGGGAAGAQAWRPAPGTSWQWQLTGKLDSSLDVAMFDIDLFSTDKSEIDALHARGRRVVCYFDTAYEPFRPDEARLRPYRGKTIDGWPDQNWLDIRAPQVVAVMKERLALAATKGCDGVEADDVDVASNDSGFPLTREDQRAFIRTLASEAHRLGLAYGLKNALEDITVLLAEVDFAVNEQCLEFDECDLLLPFIRAGKAVFHVEYPRSERESLESRAKTVCPESNKLNFDSLVKRLDLDAPRVACR